MKYATYSIQTNFGCSGITEYGANGTTSATLVSEIDLPDGSKYTLGYEPTPGHSGFVTGRLASVSLPNGGTISYAYSGGHNGIVCADGSTATLTRTTPDGTWIYTQVKGTGAASTTTITDPTTPTANQTVIQFQGIYETQRQVYQGSTSGTLLATTNTCYNGSTSPCNSTAITLPITQRAVITTLPVPGSTTLQSKSVAFYNSVGMPIEADVYAFGSGAPPTTPTRKTVITYAPLGNITAFQQTVSVKDGSDLLLAQTNYNYDETTPVPAPTGTPQLATVTGSRGNLTSVQKCISLSSCSIFLRTIMTYDTAGQLQTAKDPAGNQTSFSYTDRYYQDNGSNPPATYTSSVPTDAFVTTVTPPLNGPVTSGFYFYTGQGALSTDQNGNNSYTHFDSFGRPSTVQGPGQGTTLPWVLTTYAPSGLQADSYLGITDTTPSASCTQTRTYTYDALSRPSSVKVPEVSDASGIQCAVNYTYDNNSNLRTRIAPAPNQTTCTATVTTTYFYDALRRPTKITYSDGTTPTVQYGYDGVALTGCATTPPTLTDSNPKGSRTSMCDGSGATSWAHDAAGRILTEKRTILGVTQTTSYTYNLDGSIATVTYPSAKLVTYTVSNARRLSAAKDAANNVQFATAASYAPPGGLSGMITGQISGGFAGITESHTYNSSLEYATTKATSTAGTAMDLTLNYAVPGGDNGTVTGITNNVDTLRTQSFTYDPLNRILSARSSATSGVDCWGQNFGPDGAAADDAVANLTKINNGTQAPPPCTFGSLNATVDANNRINTDSTYATDANGNMTKDGSGTGYLYTFDAENRLVQATGMIGGPYCYVYDGNGLRVAKKSNSNSTCTTGTVTKLYWRSISGDALAETDSSGSTTNAAYNEYVFFTGRRIASRNGVGAIFYYFADQVGSTRTVTTGSGPGQTPGLLCYDADFTPYGQEISHSERLQTTACPPNYRFTGYEYDSETGLHYAFARFYSPRLGRFLSTDPLGGGVGNLQSHNAYAYVVNDPLDLIDPTGMAYGPCGPFDDFCSGSVPIDVPSCFFFPEACNSSSQGPTAPGVPVANPGGGNSGEPINPYLVEISRQLAPLNKLSDCTGEAIADEVPFGRQLLGAPSPVYTGKGSRFLARATSGNPEGKLIRLPATDAPGFIPWNYSTNAQRISQGLDAAGLPELADAAASIGGKLAGFASKFSKFAGAVGAFWTAGNVVHNTAACYNKD